MHVYIPYIRTSSSEIKVSNFYFKDLEGAMKWLFIFLKKLDINLNKFEPLLITETAILYHIHDLECVIQRMEPYKKKHKIKITECCNVYLHPEYTEDVCPKCGLALVIISK